MKKENMKGTVTAADVEGFVWRDIKNKVGFK